MTFVFRLVLLLSLSSAWLTVPIVAAAQAAVERVASAPLLSPVFGDHMVLQRGKPNLFWGWAPSGRTVRVSVGDKSGEAIAGSDGRWQLALEVPAAGGPYTVNVEGDERVVLNDVLVGDVWLCSGQSNMAFGLRGSLAGEEEVQQANLPTVRVFTVPNTVAYAPIATPKGDWKVCSPDTAPRISAVAYYFAKTLQREIGVPIGLIVSAVGGSPVESWISEAGLARTGEFGPQLAQITRLHAQGTRQHGSFLMHWLDEHDAGGRDEAWAKPTFDDTTWKRVTIPGGFQELGVANDPAIVWFRREITLPDPLPAGTARLQLGVVERMDTAYINGRWIGASSWVENPRNYAIPADVLKPGKNTVAVRVFKMKPDGGFMSPAENLRIKLGDGADIALAGEWKAAVSYDARPPAALPLDFENYPTMPTVLYNGMIAPIVPLAITGALWYQGEANFTRAKQYYKLMPALIEDWRTQFGQGEFPFYMVSLPSFMKRKTEPGVTDGWAELRGAQAATAHALRNTGLAITLDAGDGDDIHPRNKQPVGERLARLALAGHYGKAIEASGPTLRFVERRPGALALHFDHVGDGLGVRGDTLGEFVLAGADGAWHWAQARLEGSDVVVVSAPEVSAPTEVRYAWQANPLATLFNSAGLPAAPFRTDD